MADDDVIDDYGDGDDGDVEDIDEDDFFEEDVEKDTDEGSDEDEPEPEPELEKDKENPCDNVLYDEAESDTEDGFKTVHNNTVHTSKYMSKYERARVLGLRAQQLICGAPPLVEVKGSMSEFEIATEELRQHRLPMIIGRPMPNGDIVMVRVCNLNVKV